MSVAPSERAGPAPARILIADDDPDILMLLRMVLAREGYEVVAASDGLEALRMAREHAPDLCLLDVSMPGADGYMVCRELQQLGPSAPPVIFLTAHAHTNARVSGLDAGAVDYVTKPFEREELRARVRAALRTKTAKDALAAEAATDALTGLLNRTSLETTVPELVELARRNGTPLTCLMIDLDHFKQVNDTYGHAAGDRVLVETASRFAATVRKSDVLIRYGGEEFLLLLPGTNADGAVTMAARLRDALEARPVVWRADPRDNSVEIQVRASIGIAEWHDGYPDGAAMIAAADEALYRAKALGRNRVELAGP
jgi:diguanylate cyclase (GGDEF)-like protein